MGLLDEYETVKGTVDRAENRFQNGFHETIPFIAMNLSHKARFLGPNPSCQALGSSSQADEPAVKQNSVRALAPASQS